MEYTESKEPREISLKDIFKTFRHGFWIMVVCAVVFAAAAFGYSKIFIPKTYEVKVSFMVEPVSSGSSSYNDLSGYNLSVQQVGNCIEILESNTFNTKLSTYLDNKYSASQLNQMVSFTRDEDNKNSTSVFKATIKTRTANDALVIAQAIEDIAHDHVLQYSDAIVTAYDVPDEPPKAPSGPNSRRYALIAGIAGFVLALIFVFVREALDNKVKYSNDMTEIAGVPILSAVPDFGENRIILGKQNDLPGAESEAVNNG